MKILHYCKYCDKLLDSPSICSPDGNLTIPVQFGGQSDKDDIIDITPKQ